VTSQLEVTKDLTITASVGGKLTRGGSFTGNMFDINASGKTVTFQDITIDGNGNNITTDAHGIVVVLHYFW
jgi:hypothetical protein